MNEQRVIDANALKEDFDCVGFNDYDDYKRALRIIDNAPIVETYTKDDMTKEYLKGYNDCKEMTERPQGEWIKEDDEHLKGWYRCSKCGRRVEDLTDDVIIHAGCEDYTIADIYPYCHCGADMRKGGAE